jgi:hypothetical protein
MEIFLSPPTVDLKPAPASASSVFRAGALILGVVALTGFTNRRRLQRAWFPLFLVAFLLLGAWVLWASPNPTIDVFVFQRDALEAVLHGHNPYSLTFPNIYGGAHFYNPAAVVNGRVQYGFPYLPLPLIVELPFYLLTHDFRYCQLIAIALSAALMAYMRNDAIGKLAAAAFITSPRTFYVLDQAWTEPLVLLGLTATVFLVQHRPRLLFPALSLLLASKQYVVLASSAVALLPLPGRARLLSKAAVAALCITAPFILWDSYAFFRSVVLWQFSQPFRPDLLGFAPALFSATQIWTPSWVAFSLAALMSLYVLFASSRTPAGFAAGTAGILLFLFSWSKQPAPNYYYLVIGALWCAVAAARRTPITSSIEQSAERRT